MKRLIFLIALLLLPLTVAGADVTVIQGQGPREFRRVIKVDEQGRLTGGIHVIDACEAVTGWTALNNDTTGLDTDLDHVLGAKSLEFDKVDGAANTIFGGIQKTISSVDLSFLVENGGSFGYSLNVSATTDIAYCFLRLGTDASNYNEWRVAAAGLAAGWNSLRFNADVPSSAGATGNGWNAAAVTYLALGCAFDLETSTLADLRVDHVTAHVGLQVAADVNASVSSSSGGVSQVEEIDSLDQKYVPAVVANVTDGTDAGGTTCPAGTDFCYFVTMDGFKHSGIQIALGCDAGTVTATMECTIQTGTPATLTYHDVTNAFGVASLVATAGAASDLWLDNAGKLNTCTYVLVRINANTTANSGDWRIDFTKTAM